VIETYVHKNHGNLSTYKMFRLLKSNDKTHSDEYNYKTSQTTSSSTCDKKMYTFFQIKIDSCKIIVKSGKNFREHLVASFLCHFHKNQIPKFVGWSHCTFLPKPPAPPSPPPCLNTDPCYHASPPLSCSGSIFG